MIKLSIKERREQFLFFVALFVFTVGLLSFGMFYSGNSGHEISKEELEVKINENEVFENMVKETMPIVDTTFRQITRYNPNVQAVFLKNDIQLSLGSIKAAFDRKASDSRYKIFVQTAQLYDRLFTTVKNKIETSPISNYIKSNWKTALPTGINCSKPYIQDKTLKNQPIKNANYVRHKHQAS